MGRGISLSALKKLGIPFEVTGGRKIRQSTSVPNKTEQKVYEQILWPMLISGELKEVKQGTKIQLCSCVSYKPDWTGRYAMGSYLFVECKRRWENAAYKGESSWRLRETFVKLCWLATLRPSDKVVLYTVTNTGITEVVIKP